ncbi:MAG TPA: PIN domain nuclease [Geminicoccaceae bacterium]|nr:PIN domain nuclease [Geminicoccus sp.]HMU49125.1 PIN domain nuclease [Geminicoccaceae bacterium]
MIVVDSSVWIDFFRNVSHPQVELFDRLVLQEQVVLGDLILCEVLRGLRTARDVILVEDYYAAFEVVDMGGAKLARRAAANYRILRERGITIRKTVDLLIATWCLDNDARLLHRDRDFDAFERVFGLRVVRS